jgi:mycoredoxin
VVRVAASACLREDLPMSTAAAPLTMYTTAWCGFCHRLKAQLGREGIEVVEVDIEADPDAAAFVEGVNGGNQTVPTLVFADGTTMTNPSLGQVMAKLGS